MVLGAAGTGFLFLKARQMESKNTLKKVKEGHKSVKKAARSSRRSRSVYLDQS